MDLEERYVQQISTTMKVGIMPAFPEGARPAFPHHECRVRPAVIVGGIPNTLYLIGNAGRTIKVRARVRVRIRVRMTIIGLLLQQGYASSVATFKAFPKFTKFKFIMGTLLGRSKGLQSEPT